MKKKYFSVCLFSLFLLGCQKKEEEIRDFNALLNMEEAETVEWSLPQKVVLEGDFLPEDSISPENTLFYDGVQEEVVLFEKDLYGEGVR